MSWDRNLGDGHDHVWLEDSWCLRCGWTKALVEKWEVRAKSDWMQVFENDLTRAAAGLKPHEELRALQQAYQYPATKYDDLVLRPVQTPYYAGVEVPATYEKEYHASIIRVGQLEAEVKALRAEVTRLAEWRLMVAEQGARIEDGAVVGDERPAESSRPTLADHVEKVLEGLSQGMTTTSQEERLTRGLQDRKLGRISRR